MWFFSRPPRRDYCTPVKITDNNTDFLLNFNEFIDRHTPKSPLCKYYQFHYAWTCNGVLVVKLLAWEKFRLKSLIIWMVVVICHYNLIYNVVAEIKCTSEFLFKSSSSGFYQPSIIFCTKFVLLVDIHSRYKTLPGFTLGGFCSKYPCLLL